MPAILSRLVHAFQRYFSVMPAPVAPEVARASESTARAIAAAEHSREANQRLAEEMAKLDSLLRPNGH